jgi:hypothetical protein
MNDNTTPRKDPPPFYSEVKRFTQPDPTKIKPEDLLGPGYYDSTVSAIQARKFSNPKLLAESHRFESYGSYIDMKTAKNVPGPG